MYTRATISNILGYRIEHVHVHVTFKQTNITQENKQKNNEQTNYKQTKKETNNINELR